MLLLAPGTHAWVRVLALAHTSALKWGSGFSFVCVTRSLPKRRVLRSMVLPQAERADGQAQTSGGHWADVPPQPVAV